jgi:p-hydroxybenzoate 3-monooxygenase
MTSMLHRSRDDFDAELQLSQLRRVVASEPVARESWPRTTPAAARR